METVTEQTMLEKAYAGHLADQKKWLAEKAEMRKEFDELRFEKIKFETMTNILEKELDYYKRLLKAYKDRDWNLANEIENEME